MNIAACLLLMLQCVFCKENSNKWIQINTTDHTYGTPMAEEGGPLSASQCLAKCSGTEGCLSVNVHRENLQCELSSHHPLDKSLSQNQRLGWTVYYIGEPPAIPTIVEPPPTAIIEEPSGTTVSQWVQTVTRFSSEYSTTWWSASKVVGPPDVFPKYGDYSSAWESYIKDANQFLDVQFAEAVNITGVEIYETYNAGAVKAIKALQGSSWTTLWSTGRVQRIIRARIFAPTLSVMTSQAKDLRVEFNCTLVGSSWVAIDAIKLVGTK